MNALREQLQESLKNNEVKKIKNNKFAETANETIALKEKTTILKHQLK